MSEIKHTPGPWKLVAREVLEDGSVYPTHLVRGPEDYQVSAIESHAAAELAIKHPEQGWGIREADARLIAAAPELLEALLWCKSQGWIQYTKRIPNQNAAFCDGVDKALAAIAKAIGSQS